MSVKASDQADYKLMVNQMKNVATTNAVSEVDCLRAISTFLRNGFKQDQESEDRFAHMLGQWTENFFVTYAALNSTIHEIISDALLFKFNESRSVQILNCTGFHLYQGLNVLTEGHSNTAEPRYAAFLKKLKSNVGFTRHTFTFTFPINQEGTGLDAKSEDISKSCTLVNVAQQAEGSLLRFYDALEKNGDHPVLVFDEQKIRGEAAKKGITKPVDFELNGTLPLLLQRDKDISLTEHFETKGVPRCFWDVTFIFSMSREKFQKLGPRLDTLGLMEVVDDGSGLLVITASAYLCYISFMLRMTTYLTCAQPITAELLAPQFKELAHVTYTAPKKDVKSMLEKQELATSRVAPIAEEEEEKSVVE